MAKPTIQKAAKAGPEWINVQTDGSARDSYDGDGQRGDDDDSGVELGLCHPVIIDVRAVLEVHPWLNAKHVVALETAGGTPVKIRPLPAVWDRHSDLTLLDLDREHLEWGAGGREEAEDSVVWEPGHHLPGLHVELSLGAWAEDTIVLCEAGLLKPL
eukprot:CAMPEP_0174336368 /NCGR_PEP_ID=MMETSP0810-20121108/21503_1 /TAXON_ID=73025 ORGANISM="Eutreptiella gymnastica-like, Strain CCMP1594" /NCGR_SAMPLE_ID=MMETSP0810 /ASSEMBLY_ACC=CAM_ASM_000659 /LENGTH=156 /DNA_ID=CAMNT_0015455257 /DNA_START=421 /DNA_END=889 /DNA_ORIENTATION=+